MYKKRYIVLILSTILSVFNIIVAGQEITSSPVIIPANDTSIINQKEIYSDTSKQDTTKQVKKIKEDFVSEVKYTAEDSIIISIGDSGRTVYLYGAANVKYSTIELTADYIEFNMSTNEVFARGVPNDTSGIIEGLPVFVDEDQTFNAHTLKYNFKTQKGYIEAVKTKQDEGYLHAKQTRKDQFGHIHLKDGKYTTCDLDHPHFYLHLTKAKSMPGDKIVSGPAYLVIADIPLPIGLPFGFFPSKKTNTSGILLPEYGEEISRGFYLRNGGYYWAVSDYIDLRFTGDIYTNGTWGARVGSAYKYRYKFTGNFNLRYYQNITGEKGLKNYTKATDYSISWSHNQDPKANPSMSYGASVNLSTRKFDQNHSRILANALTNTKQSSISFQKNWQNTPFNLSASANHSQNSNTGSVDLNLPKVSFNMNRIYPFRSDKSTNDRWYQQIQLSYTGFLDNRIKTVDTLLFTNRVWENMNTGFRHEVPFSYNYKPKKLKNFTISPSLKYSGVAYTKYINQRIEQGQDGDTIIIDTINKVTYAHSIMPSISFGFNPKIYGMFMFKPESKVQSIRHVISPSVSLSLVPDMSKISPNYYRELKDENGKVLETYSIYKHEMFGTPSLNRRSRTMSVALRNTLEMKLRQGGDTSQKVNKVRLLDNFDFASSMNFDDSIKWNPISINGGTSILKGKMNINFRGSFDPYAQDDKFRRINQSEYNVSGKLGRLTSAGLSTGINFQSKQGGDKDAGTDERESSQTPGQVAVDSQYDNVEEGYPMGKYVDFNVPWSFKIDYSLNYSNSRNRKDVIQTLRFSGDLSLTSRWKINFNSGYDLKAKKITTTDFSIYRDLHCWEMRLTAIPFGIYKSFNFQINVKSAILQDLKYEKRIPWQDNL